MPRGDWDDISPAQRKALQYLATQTTGSTYAGNLRGHATMATLRALHRYGLIKCDDIFIESGTVVTLTESGRVSAEPSRPRSGV